MRGRSNRMKTGRSQKPPESLGRNHWNRAATKRLMHSTHSFVAVPLIVIHRLAKQIRRLLVHRRLERVRGEPGIELN